MSGNDVNHGHWAYRVHPRRAENELPKEVKRRLDESFRKHEAEKKSIDAISVPTRANEGS